MRKRSTLSSTRPEAPGPMLLSVPEAALLMGLGRCTVWSLCTSGALKSVKIGKTRRVVAADIPRWIADNASVTVA